MNPPDPCSAADCHPQDAAESSSPPQRSLGQRWLIRVLPVMLGIAVTQCAHQQQATTSTAAKPQADWQVVSRDPLTYAPKGFPPPAAGSYEAVGAEYVYLADRKTRFYIPPRHKDLRAQALAVREASRSQADKMRANAESVVEGVLRGGLWLVFYAASAMSGP